MMRSIAVTIVGALLFTGSEAHAADEESTWEIDVHVAYAALGGKRPTGGIMPSIEAKHVWDLGGVFSWSLGADLGIFGFADDTHWLGVLGGPTASIRAKPFNNGVVFGLGIAADFGRIPICNDWALCLRYVGFFPAVTPSFGYQAEKHVGFGFACPIRVVSTLGWSGASFEPQAFGRVHW